MWRSILSVACAILAVPLYACAITIVTQTSAQSDSGSIHATAGESVASGDSSAQSGITTRISANNATGTAYIKVASERNGVRTVSQEQRQITGANTVIRVATSTVSRNAPVSVTVRSNRSQQSATSSQENRTGSGSAVAVAITLSNSSSSASSSRLRQPFFFFGNVSASHLDVANFFENIFGSVFRFFFGA
jgi:hypothetical protein